MRRRSGRVFRRVVLIVFLGVVVGCAFAVLYLGTSTGLTFGGSATRISAQSGTYPVYGQAGWLRNTAPWPITITSVTTNASNATGSPTVYLVTSQTSPLTESSKEPGWASTASKAPVQLDGGALRYLAFSFSPQQNQVAAMTSVTVNFTGPLGLPFHETFSGTRVATASSALPAGVLGVAPYGNPESLDAYIAAIRAELLQPDPKSAALLMGPDVTQAQAQAFITAQKGYAATDGVSSHVVTHDGRQQTITFFKTSLASDPLPVIDVTWSDYRWTIRPAGN